MARTDFLKEKKFREMIEQAQSFNSAARQQSILQQIAEERRLRFWEEEASAKIDKKLAETEKEYLEAIKAQEIMDQIDENRKRDA